MLTPDSVLLPLLAASPSGDRLGIEARCQSGVPGDGDEPLSSTARKERDTGGGSRCHTGMHGARNRTLYERQPNQALRLHVNTRAE